MHDFTTVTYKGCLRGKRVRGYKSFVRGARFVF